MILRWAVLVVAAILAFGATAHAQRGGVAATGGTITGVQIQGNVRAEPETNTEAPRGFSKTTVKCFLVPIYQAIMEPRAFAHYLNVQSIDTKALAVNTAIKMNTYSRHGRTIC